MDSSKDIERLKKDVNEEGNNSLYNGPQIREPHAALQFILRRHHTSLILIT